MNISSFTTSKSSKDYPHTKAVLIEEAKYQYVPVGIDSGQWEQLINDFQRGQNTDQQAWPDQQQAWPNQQPAGTREPNQQPTSRQDRPTTSTNREKCTTPATTAPSQQAPTTKPTPTEQPTPAKQPAKNNRYTGTDGYQSSCTASD